MAEKEKEKETTHKYERRSRKRLITDSLTRQLEASKIQIVKAKTKLIMSFLTFKGIIFWLIIFSLIYLLIVDREAFLKVLDKATPFISP